MWFWVTVVLGIGVVLYLSGRFFRKLADEVAKWRPSDDHSKETDYRKDVAGFLRTTLPGYTIIEEYGNERSRADLVVCSSAAGIESSQEKFVIELKYRLEAKVEVDRVIGQCVGYRQFGYHKVILLLIDTEPNMVAILKSRAAVDVLAGFLVLIEVRKAPVPVESSLNVTA